MSALRSRLHAVARGSTKWVADAVPPGWIVPLRDRYVDLPAGSRRRVLIRPVLQAMRLKEFDWIESFDVADRDDVRLAAVDSPILNRVFWLGVDGYEPGEVRLWEELCRSHERVLELGANVGLYTVFGARAAVGPYVAVEPNPASVAVLTRNLELNELDRVEVVAAAVAGDASAGSAELVIPAADLYESGDEIGPSAGAYLTSAVDIDLPGRASVTVPLVAVDELLDGVDLIKMDIEGLELDVLDAVRDRIVADTPTIVIEVRNSAVTLKAFLGDLIADAGYHCYAVVDGAVREIAADTVATGNLAATYGTRDVTLSTRTDLADIDLSGGSDG